MASLDLQTQRMVYIITYSRADTSKFPTRESFSEAVIEAWKFFAINILHWVVCIEAHANLRFESGDDLNYYHFHMALKLEKRGRWLQVKKYFYPIHTEIFAPKINEINFIPGRTVFVTSEKYRPTNHRPRTALCH